jgi:hypothetical protein
VLPPAVVIVVAIPGIIHKEDNDVRRPSAVGQAMSPMINGFLHRPPCYNDLGGPSARSAELCKDLMLRLVVANRDGIPAGDRPSGYLSRNCRKFYLTAFASNFDRIVGSQKVKKAHKRPQAATISRKSVFGNAAILTACQRSPRDVHSGGKP